MTTFLNKFFSLPKELWNNRRLIWKLSKNDFKTRYAGSYLGIVWAFVQPVITILVYWLVFEKGFSVEMPNPTNEVVAEYYGVKPLWRTAYSQGIVVKAENESDYFIVMECSGKNRGYKRTQVILTMGGCM